MKVRLVAVGGDVRASELSLQLPTVVGRGREAALTLPHPLVSRRHCELYEREGRLWVRDLGSLNGTYVGSRKVKESEVPSGELLTVATLNFRVIYADPGVEDAMESPLLIGSEDSTHGLSGVLRGRERVRAQAASPAADKQGAGPTIERDTEWQIGTVSPRKSNSDGEDLSSLLNGS